MSELYHHGILGQKWGVRRYQNEDGTLTAAGKKRYSRVIGSDEKVSVVDKKYKRLKGFHEILDKNGKRVGQIIVDDEGDNDHIDWLGIKEKERRKGYGQSAINIIINDSKRKGKKSITLDAAGLDPAAIHIYEKMGFQAIEKFDNDVWNTIVYMKKDLS